MVIITSIIIRRVLPDEAYEYAACHIACWRAAYKGIVPDLYLDSMLAEQEQRTEKCRQQLCNPDGYEFYCAVSDNKMVGRLILSKSRDEDKPDAGEIAAIYLRREYWDKGYGRQMMNYSISALKRMDYHEIILWVLEKNSRARRFYEKCGFTHDGTKKEVLIGRLLTEIRYVIDV